MTYDELLIVAENEGVTVVEYEFDGKYSGLYCDGYAFIDKTASNIQKCCTLAEELGHHFTAASNIVETDSIDKCKQEQLGRRWGFENILPVQKIIDAIINGCDTLYAIAEQLEVTPEYLQDALKYYSQKYGPDISYGDYVVVFSSESLIVHPILDDII